MTAKRKQPARRLSLHPMSPEIAIRRALSTPAPKSGPGAIKCAECGKPIASPRDLTLRKNQPYHRACAPKRGAR